MNETKFGTAHVGEIDGKPLPDLPDNQVWVRHDGSKGQMLREGDILCHVDPRFQPPLLLDRVDPCDWNYLLRPTTLYTGQINLGAFGTRDLPEGEWYVIDPKDAREGDLFFIGEWTICDEKGSYGNCIVIRRFVRKREPRSWTGKFSVDENSFPSWLINGNVTITEVLD